MTTCEELGREWQRIDQIIAVETHEATYDRLQNELDAVERLIRETKAQSMPDASAKLSLAAGRLGGTIPNEMRDVISEIANNFGKGAPSLSDLVTLRHILELVERLPVDVAPVEFDIMSSAAKEEVLLLLRDALNFVGQLH